MTIDLITTIKRYRGISTDTKPTVVTDAPEGSDYYESDTGKLFIASSTGWIERLDSSVVLSTAITAAISSGSAAIVAGISSEKAAIVAGITSGVDAIVGSSSQSLTEVVTQLADIASHETNSTSFYVGTATVSTAGTPVQLSSGAIPDGCYLSIVARSSNLGNIYVGNTSTIAIAGTFVMMTRDVLNLRISNSNLVWVDASTDACSIQYIVEGTA